jgi:hypothetical protein
VTRLIAITATVLLAMAGAARAGCSEMVRMPWKAAAKYGLSIEAHALGPNCAKGIIVLLVTGKSGNVVYSTTRQPEYVSMFAEGITDGKTMSAALKTWLETGFETSPASTAELPDWKQGAEVPERESEFGYFPEQDMVRKDYLKHRAKAHPIFCFVQGMESETCIAAESDNSIIEFGGLTFPG